MFKSLAFAFFIGALNAQGQAALWSCNFTNSAWLDSWNTGAAPKQGIKFGDTNITQVTDATAPGGGYLRLVYPSGSDAPSDGPPVGGAEFFGAVLHTNGNSPMDALTLQFSLRFATNFNFVKGGKLPGLYGGIGNTDTGSSNLPDGTNGFTTRFMWRTSGAGEAYPFLPTSPTSGGTELGKGNWYFTNDFQWHTLRQTTMMNTIGNSNGVIQVWYDGVMTLNSTNLFFRSADSLKIDGVLFQTFFGGNGSSWRTPANTYADFANFSISNAYPALTVTKSGSKFLVSWPTNSLPGLILQSSPGLSATNVWTTVVTNPPVVSGQFVFTNSNPTGQLFTG